MHNEAWSTSCGQNDCSCRAWRPEDRETVRRVERGSGRDGALPVDADAGRERRRSSTASKRGSPSTAGVCGRSRSSTPVSSPATSASRRRRGTRTSRPRSRWDGGSRTSTGVAATRPKAGRAALDYGFDVLGLDEVVSFTTVANLRSQRVMQKLGMTHDPADDFDHPALPEGHPQRPHVLYRGELHAV